ncbi:MAG: oligosaccharide flippase family protein [Muribaculum sp.]|nr:oligosaccharide flippase family protein [Muribaculum sp.]
MNFSHKLKRSALFKDSFWAVFGNGFGTFLLLIAGVLIARFLGKDLYGEYGVVKTNMFYLAGFSTFGLGLTSTRFISKYQNEDKTQIIGIIDTATRITLCFSSFIAILLCIFAEPLADYIDEPNMKEPFRVLSGIIVIKSLGTTSVGILAGLHKFRAIAINALASGFFMLTLCVPLTLSYGLRGAFIALAVSQVINTTLNYVEIYREKGKLPIYYKAYNTWKLVSFSFPVAMQEISYSVCNWVGLLALTKLSSIGEVGIYTATAQWNAVILFIPGLLNNVVLSHLSRRSDAITQKHKVRRMLMVYCICTIIPFVLVYIFSGAIASFYGSQFAGIVPVLKVLTLTTIPICCSDVFKSEFLAMGRPWLLFSIRCCRDILLMIVLIVLLTIVKSIGGAMIFAVTNLIVSILFFLTLAISYLLALKREKI